MKKLIYSQEDLNLILSVETQEKDKEIERLNNIINELEEMILFNLIEFKRNKDYFIDEKNMEQLYEYLKELKEGNK